MLSPNINIFRDPRWGRGHETYGEDPYLTSKMGVSFIKGLQGDDEKYMKVAACAKHYCVHSGPESMRHTFDAKVSQKTLYETYLPAFKACVQEAKAATVMGAYNRTNGEACTASQTFLKDILRTKWGFDGFVLSDAGAVEDIHKSHKITNSPAESAAMAIKNGCELNIGFVYEHLGEAIEQGLIDIEKIRDAVYELILIRMKLGMFDDDEKVGYAQIPYEKNDSLEHHALSKEMCAQSLVLLKNDGILPLKHEKSKTIAVIGPNANSYQALIGNYFGTASTHSTILDGFRMAVNTKIIYAPGCSLTVNPEAKWGEKSSWGFAEAIAAANRADVVILALGMDAQIEGEEYDAAHEGGDKKDLSLPGVQNELLRTICRLKKPTVLLNLTGSCVNLVEASSLCNAVIQCWYPGQFGGEMIAKCVFGDISPSGKLPVTFYKNVDDLPPFDDYNMAGRTYKYLEKTPLYPFGFGLSYGKFEYYKIDISRASVKVGEDITVSVFIRNVGKQDAYEVVQVYLADEESTYETPKYKLAAFKKVFLPVGREKKVNILIKADEMAMVTDNGEYVIEKGAFSLYVSGGQPDDYTTKLYDRESLHIGFLVE